MRARRYLGVCCWSALSYNENSLWSVTHRIAIVFLLLLFRCVLLGFDVVGGNVLRFVVEVCFLVALYCHWLLCSC